jgi:hypothetical protein
MSDNKQEFLPFHAINEFMRNDYRLAVVRTALQALPKRPAELRASIDRLTKRFVQVPGFRNSAQAPTGVKMSPMAAAFEKSPELVAAILAAWAEVHPELRQQVYDLLTGRGWELLPVEVNRAKLPGFVIHWPKGENFEGLNQAFRVKYPEAQLETDDVSLMVVWLSARLPYEEEEQQAEQTAS